jgi:NTP pyrophosphatase (non-canonical NTP hydrolase)
MSVPYAAFVARLVKPGADIINELTPAQADLLHMSIGVSGEAGELLDAVKKHVIYQKPIDRENVVEELGDLKFYIQGIQNNLGISDEEVEAHNRKKLSARYDKLTYSNEAAQARADKC